YCFVYNYFTSTEIYTLSLHDALPILKLCIIVEMRYVVRMALYQRLLAFMNVTKLEKVTFDIQCYAIANAALLSPPSRYVHIRQSDRKSTRLNSSHVKISYAVFCLKKK